MRVEGNVLVFLLLNLSKYLLTKLNITGNKFLWSLLFTKIFKNFTDALKTKKFNGIICIKATAYSS